MKSSIIRKIIPILFTLVVLSGNTSFAATSSVTASDLYVIAGENNVAFTCEVILDEEENAETITIDIDYQNDDEIDETEIIQVTEGIPIAHTFYHPFEEAGYWDIVVAVTIGDDRSALDPVTVSAARWRFPAIGMIGGVATTAAVAEDGTIYFGSEDSILYAVNPNGTLKWKYMTGGPVNASAAIDSDGNIYFGSEDGYLYCRTPENGEKWSPFLTGGGIFGSPALSQDETAVYIASTDGRLYAIAAENGKARWPSAFMTGAKIVSSPVVGFDGTIYIGSLDHYLYAINPDGSLLWKIDLDSGIYGGIALDGDGTIYLGTSMFGGAKDTVNKFYSISLNGEIKWQTAVLSGFASTPVIRSSGEILAGSYDNQLYSFYRNGNILWKFSMFSDDVINASAVGSNSLLYTASKDGIIYALRDDWDYFTGKEIAWKYDMRMPVTTSSPVVANGSVYIGTYARDGGVLWAFAAESKKDSKFLDYAVTEADPSSPWPMIRNNINNSGATGFDSNTIAPGVVHTDPVNGVEDFNVSRDSISVTFSKPIDPDLIYVPPTEETPGFYGFTVSPFDNDPDEFEIQWVSDIKVELVLPPGVSFEKEVVYTATIQTLQPENPENSSGVDPERLLSPYVWQFSNSSQEEIEHSGDRGCFISCLAE
jgi:outer membrane protein assembly factor BamB